MSETFQFNFTGNRFKMWISGKSGHLASLNPLQIVGASSDEFRI